MKKLAPRIERLKNGLRVVSVEAPHLASAYVGVMFGVGSRHETPRDNGLSHFLEHMVFRGTANYNDASDLNVAAESAGGALDASTSRDYTLYGTTCHPTKIDVAIELLSEVVLRPKLKHIEIERSIIQEEMRESLGASGIMVDLDTVSHREVYGEHPLGQPIEGTPRTVARFDKADLVRHRNAFYTIPNCVILLAGNISFKEWRATLDKAFAALPDGPPVVVAPPALQRGAPTFKWVDDEGSSQVELRISYPAFGMSDPDHAALVMLGRVLGEGLSSRLHTDLIDGRGLAYSLSTMPSLFADGGTYEIEASVAPAKAVNTLNEMFQFMHRALRSPPTKRELEHSKDKYRINMDFLCDSPSDVAHWIARSLIYGVLADIDLASNQFLGVTTADCARVAKRVLRKESAVVCGVGKLPLSKQKQLRALSGVGSATRGSPWSGRS